MSLERAMVEVVESFGFDAGDPRQVMLLLGIRLAREYDRAPSTRVSSELQKLLLWATEQPERKTGELDLIRARYATRRVDALLGGNTPTIGRRTTGRDGVA